MRCSSIPKGIKGASLSTLSLPFLQRRNQERTIMKSFFVIAVALVGYVTCDYTPDAIAKVLDVLDGM